MTDGKKVDRFNGKWAVVTVHPRLPSRGEQIARARAWGVTDVTIGRDDISALIIDEVAGVGRTTNWPKHLIERGNFLATMSRLKPQGDEVWFCTPLCVGFSAKHARETISAVWEAGMLVYIHTVKNNGPALYASGDDLTELLEMVEQEANASAVRVSRARSR